MNNLSLRQLRALRAVATEGGFSAAADRLSLSPAALSGLVKEAESQLGVRLFDRSTRRVELSAIGAEFLPLVERVLQDLDEAVSRITNLKEMRRGIVRIAAPESLSCTMLPPAMAAFGQRYPQVELRFFDVPVEEVIARTLSGEIDLGISTALVDGDHTLISTPFLRAPLILAVRRDDPLARLSRAGWPKGGDQPFITHFRRPQDWLPWVFARDGGAAPKTLMVKRMNTALAMVKAGTGFTVVSAYAGEFVASFGLKAVPLINPQADRHFAILTRPGHSLAPQVEVFRDFFVGFARQWSRRAAVGRKRER